MWKAEGYTEEKNINLDYSGELSPGEDNKPIITKRLQHVGDCARALLQIVGPILFHSERNVN